jgi:4-hydroxy-tetrahydrodipicolinate synthase
VPAFQINGVVPIIPSPFRSDESLDVAGLEALVRFAAVAGCSAVCLPAYASEFYKLSDEERIEVVRHAVRLSSGRIAVIGQVNYAATRLVVKAARVLEAAGVDAIASAVPRLFSSNERDIFRHFDTILSAIRLPLLIQDFNPGGATLTLQFVADLHRLHPHFRYLKLEEPLMAAKVKGIIDATGGEVGVLEGWGGMYLVELIEAGICGVMPGLAISDILVRVFELVAGGRKQAGYEIFVEVLPQISFSLQNMELFHHADKSLLAARGILPDMAVRDLTLTPHETDRAYMVFLNQRILALLERLRMPPNPLSVVGAV